MALLGFIEAAKFRIKFGNQFSNLVGRRGDTHYLNLRICVWVSQLHSLICFTHRFVVIPK